MAHYISGLPLAYIIFVVGISLVSTAALTLFKLTSSRKSSQTNSLMQLIIGFIILGVVVSVQSTFFIIDVEINLIQVILIGVLLSGGFLLAYYSHVQRGIHEKIEAITFEGKVNVFSKILIVLALILCILGLINFFNINVFNSYFEGAALTTIISFFLISLIGLRDFFSKLKIIPKSIVLVPLLIGLLALLGHLFDLHYLFGLSPEGGTSIPTALSIILISGVIFFQDKLSKLFFKTLISFFLITSIWFAILPRFNFGIIITILESVSVVLSPLTSALILLISFAYFIKNFKNL